MGPFTIGQIPAQPQFFNVMQPDGVTPWDLSNYSSINMIVTGPGETSVPGSAMGAVSKTGPSAVNQITLTWNSNASPFVSAGAYRFQFQLVGPGNVIDVTGTGTFDVESLISSDDAVTNWVTIGQVLTITNQSVTQDQIDQAQGIIDIVTRRTIADQNRIRARDLAWLQKATAFQAVWMASQPDIFSKTAYASVSQDGFSATPRNKSSLYLGPLAERALKNCSWLRSRSLRVKTAFIDGNNSESLDPENDDSILIWEPMQ